MCDGHHTQASQSKFWKITFLFGETVLKALVTPRDAAQFGFTIPAHQQLVVKNAGPAGGSSDALLDVADFFDGTRGKRKLPR